VRGEEWVSIRGEGLEKVMGRLKKVTTSWTQGALGLLLPKRSRVTGFVDSSSEKSKENSSKVEEGSEVYKKNRCNGLG